MGEGRSHGEKEETNDGRVREGRAGKERSAAGERRREVEAAEEGE